ncbi:hypothetical protein [Actinomycetospora lutea]|nr:hypothetical protein [Actinomycetospora lutea]
MIDVRAGLPDVPVVPVVPVGGDTIEHAARRPSGRRRTRWVERTPPRG